jgi:hypothetical protein
MASKFMREKRIKIAKSNNPHVKQRFAVDAPVKPYKPSDPSKAYAPRVDGMMVRRYKRTNGCMMSQAAREALAVHLERREAFFAGLAAVV